MSIVHFQKWYKTAADMPVFQQVLKAQQINNQLHKRLVELYDEAEEKKRKLTSCKAEIRDINFRIREKERAKKALLKSNARLNETINELRRTNVKLINKETVTFCKPLLEYKNAMNLSYDKLAKIIGVPCESLRVIVKQGLSSKYEAKIRAFIKNLKVPK